MEGKIPPMIDQVDHDIKLSCNVTIQPRKALKSTGVVRLPVLSKWLNVTAEPMQNIGNFHDVHAIESYTHGKTGNQKSCCCSSQQFWRKGHLSKRALR